MVRVVMTGGREFVDKIAVYKALDQVLAKHPQMILVHGAARGADTLAGQWAADRGISVEVHPANWDKHGKAAGFIRNEQMAKSGVIGCVAFPGGNGTAHMVRICQENNVPVWAPYGIKFRNE